MSRAKSILSEVSNNESNIAESYETIKYLKDAEDSKDLMDRVIASLLKGMVSSPRMIESISYDAKLGKATIQFIDDYFIPHQRVSNIPDEADIYWTPKGLSLVIYP